MIHDDAEYQVAVCRREQQRERLARDEAQLKEAGLSAEELRRALDPRRSFHLQA